MTNTHHIERSVIASLLNFEYETEVDSNIFNDLFHRKLINGYNRLKAIGEALDFEVLRLKFMDAKKWTIQEDTMLTDIMTNTTPFGHKSTFDRYLKILKDTYKENSDKRFSIWVSE